MGKPPAVSADKLNIAENRLLMEKKDVSIILL